MKKKITSLFRKAYNKLLRKKTHGTIWEQKFDGYVKPTSEGLQGRIVLHIHNEDK